MRPIYFFTLIFYLATVRLVAQDPVALAMKVMDWPVPTSVASGTDWSLFSKQYYCISNWNLTGASIGYGTSLGKSAIVIYRDGIPGFSWYHFNVSHFRQFKKISGMLQLRFSAIGMKDRPPVFRLGGNIQTNWSVNESLLLSVSIFDFPGWILPSAVIARGDPAIQFFLFHVPGRLIALAAGFRISRSEFGPVCAGIRVNLNDQIDMIGLLDVLPFGMSVGVSYRIKRLRVRGWVRQQGGLGMSPMVEVGSRK